jgi:hypothetical protein
VSEALTTTEQPTPVTSLAIASGSQMVASGVDDKDFAEYSGSYSYLPYLQLCGASTNLCKEGKQPIGTYALVHDKTRHDDLGKSVNIFICGMRLKAFEMAGEGNFSFYDPKSDDFKRVARLSGEKDSGCMAGPEFLCYIPSKKMFATFFMASMSARNEAPAVKALLGRAATLTVSLAENKKKQKWHVTKTLPCSVPLDPPDSAELTMQQNKFCNPISSKIKVAPKETPAEADRVR